MNLNMGFCRIKIDKSNYCKRCEFKTKLFPSSEIINECEDSYK